MKRAPRQALVFAGGEHPASRSARVFLRETLAAHYSDERGVVLDSRSWSITARRRAQHDNAR
jgi:hypothetical protein